MANLSIVIPTRNEEDTLELLVQRICQVLTQKRFKYEIIIIDDHSTDSTLAIAQRLAALYPLVVRTKQGSIGKAFSILEGIQLAQYDLICTIDADLQYPPEAIPDLLKQIERGSDIVIAERAKNHPNLLRNIALKVYRIMFAKFLHGIQYDVSSGLKIFRAEVGKRLPLNPDAWSWDLEFILKAQQANYVISSHPVDFQARIKDQLQKRKSNRNWLTASWQMIKAAVYFKVAQPLAIPFSVTQQQIHGRGFDFNGKRFVTHNDMNPQLTALYQFNNQHILIMVLAAVMFLALSILNWHATLITIVALLTILYFMDLLFNLYLIVRSFAQSPEIKISETEIKQVEDKDWPKYTIFCPLYREHEVIPQFVNAITQLDYPKDKLQVMLLLEQDDAVTIAKAREFDLPDYFEIVVVPDSLPKTKPKACNYGLSKATGEYVVIYDAEDVPDQFQLKKAVAAFNKLDTLVICIQAKLNFYNPHQNLLTRLFTSEYSLWFDLVLTGMQAIQAPIPLGGTSNHFRVRDLFKLRGWDAFNVTEDCDLGMRLVKQGYRTAILDSTTLEEANSDLSNWFWQRSRWIKGYMQSYFVHLRDFGDFLYDWRQPHGLTFQLIVGGKVLSMLINPVMWLIVVIYFVFRPVVGSFIDSFFPTPVFYMAIFSLIFGNALYLYYYMVGNAKRGHEELIKFGILVPFYWMAMSAAAYMAVYKLITAPHHWSKTKHGLHLSNKKGLAQSREKIGNFADYKLIISEPYSQNLIK